jgi:DNA end-binding protein Ku
MAEQLVNELEDKWKPEAFHDEFREKLEKLVEEKVKAGEGEHIMKPLEGEEVKPSADILDLTELLRRSLRKSAGAKAAQDEEQEEEAEEPPRKAARRKAANDEEAPARRRAAASKSTARASTSVKPKPRKKAA